MGHPAAGVSFLISARASLLKVKPMSQKRDMGHPRFLGAPYCGSLLVGEDDGPGRTSLGALTLVLGSVVESFRLTIFLSASTGKVAT